MFFLKYKDTLKMPITSHQVKKAVFSLLRGIWDQIVAIIALTTAIIALVHSIDQAEQTRKHNKLTVKPHITKGTEQTLDKTATHHITRFYIHNSGIGPAFIKNKIIYYKGDLVVKNDKKSFEDFVSMERSFNIKTHGFLGKETMFAEGEIFTIFETYPYEPNIQKDVEYFFDNLELCIDYQSVYEEEMFFLCERHKNDHNSKKENKK